MKVYLIGFLITISVMTGRAETTPVRVLSDRVNVRAASELTAEVVAQVHEGDVLSALSFTEEWVEVEPPETVDCWIHREFCVDGRVSAKKLNVRSGPGINYKIVGELERGATVEVRGEFGEWIRIAPPPAASVWISRDYVEPLVSPGSDAVGVGPVPHERYRETAAHTQIRPPVPRRAEALPPRSPDESSVVEDGVRVRPKPQVQRSVPLPPDWKLIPLEGQGKVVEQEGMLKTVGFMIRRPTRYRLVQYHHGRTEMICYVWGNDAQLDGYLGQHLLLKGRQYWVHGYRSPILVVEQVTLTSDAVPAAPAEPDRQVYESRPQDDVDQIEVQPQGDPSGMESTPYQPYN